MPLLEEGNSGSFGKSRLDGPSFVYDYVLLVIFFFFLIQGAQTIAVSLIIVIIIIIY